jgi:hypothetical protein
MTTNARNYRKNPHAANWLMTFHTAGGANYRPEATEDEAVSFVTGTPAPASKPLHTSGRTEFGVSTIEIEGYPVKVGGAYVTEKQAKWIIDIATTREAPAGRTAESVLIRLEQGFAKAAGTAFITSYKDLPKLADAPAGLVSKVEKFHSATPVVPAGRYALVHAEGIKFYRVTKGKGRWEGRTFVEAQASDDHYPIRNPESRNLILAAIAEDRLAAEQLYGRELGKCSRCGRTLTDETSRAYGIGPECRKK